MIEYKIRDLTLASAGSKKIDWVSKHMPILNKIREKYTTEQPLRGKRVAVSVHLEAKTAYLALTLKELGAELTVTGSNPLSTQDDVAAALVAKGVSVFAWHGASEEEYLSHLTATLKTKPVYLIDDGGDLVSLLHTRYRELLPMVKGGCEETTTGVQRLRAMASQDQLAFPMIAVNDALCKHLFDNRYGTGQSSWDGIMRTTNLVVAGKTVVVVGYGWCGKGVAARAKGLGARVIVCEVDPIKALEALMDGYAVLPSVEAARRGDFFISVTGCARVLAQEHFQVMKDGAILANAGHFDVEIDKEDLRKLAVEVSEARKNITEYRLADGRKLYLLAEGRLVNLAAGDGHPAEIMDLSFALQILSLLYLESLNREGRLVAGLYSVPQETDCLVARLALEAFGVQIDALTEAQQKYLNSW
ncbi:MAG TPA: adenosylhomocysteinase [Firmicutes bacterium]|nr:adenosylhomocysteinase [Bacillota bacterium]